MPQTLSCQEATSLLLQAVVPVQAQTIPLSQCAGRILFDDVKALCNVPLFDRSPYDGYALRAADTQGASLAHPVSLRIVEEVPAGSVPTKAVTAGTAVKILTGAPLPAGADAITKFEDTVFTPQTVTLYAPLSPGDNVIRAGEDTKEGQLLIPRGSVLDAGAAGTLAAQGVAQPTVYQKPVVGILSTGNEVQEVDVPLAPGKIRNTNRHALEAALLQAGCTPLYLGLASDRAEDIAALIQTGLATCDAVVMTGGVSVGDYDMTPAAFDLAGIHPLFRGVQLKPGGACLYGTRDSRLVCGLSGNPASALTNFYAVALPAFRKLAGHANPLPEEITVRLSTAFLKHSPSERLLRGRLAIVDGVAQMVLQGEQGNAVLSSMVGANLMALVPQGSGPLPEGTILKGFLI